MLLVNYLSSILVTYSLNLWVNLTAATSMEF